MFFDHSNLPPSKLIRCLCHRHLGQPTAPTPVSSQEPAGNRHAATTCKFLAGLRSPDPAQLIRGFVAAHSGRWRLESCRNLQVFELACLSLERPLGPMSGVGFRTHAVVLRDVLLGHLAPGKPDKFNVRDRAANILAPGFFHRLFHAVFSLQIHLSSFIMMIPNHNSKLVSGQHIYSLKFINVQSRLKRY